ncbi:hypothetical protein H072_10510 [Dactylellina haptotyla CBS 200.50]|uniref:F-box domain-containing protein n=1 Tax=Dactylellina haptotyla (strain CBS 200.50) TaxID=1284197 RepID=S8BAB6_DACHA|nr:hypothetical protein H072_10510 [Dactylellina haptotyla CBS 200.50]
MMIQITDLPSELLLHIFRFLGGYNKHYPIINCKLTCKRFRDVAQNLPIRAFKLALFHKHQLEWKFTRYLLNHPDSCNQLKRLNVKWCKHHDPTSQVARHCIRKRWIWTKQELRLLKNFSTGPSATSQLTPDTYTAIVLGVNAEALVPFILCFAGNLEYFRLGEYHISVPKAVTYVEPSSPSQAEVLEYYLSDDALLPQEGISADEWSEARDGDENHNHDRAGGRRDPQLDGYVAGTLTQRDDIHFPQGRGKCLWFHVNMCTGDIDAGGYCYLPGLVNVKTLILGENERRMAWELKKTADWSAGRYLAPILFLPRLEFLYVESCSSVVGEPLGFGNLKSEEEEEEEGDDKGNVITSKVRILKMHNSKMTLDELVAAAGVTRDLVDFEAYPNYIYGKLGDTRPLVEALRRCNAGLELDMISIMRKGGEILNGKFYASDYSDDVLIWDPFMITTNTAVTLGPPSFSFQHLATALTLQTELESPESRADLDIVISHYNEDFTELKSIIADIQKIPVIKRLKRRIYLYTKNQHNFNHTDYITRFLDINHTIVAKNEGREGGTYLKHIIENYDTLARHTLFMQAAPHAFSEFLETLSTYFYEDTGVLSLGPYQRCSCGACRDPYNHPIVWNRVPEIYTLTHEKFCPKSGLLLTFKGQMVASNKHIRKTKIEAYERIYDTLRYSLNLDRPAAIWGFYEESVTNPYFGHSLERSWMTLFHCVRPELARTCERNRQLDRRSGHLRRDACQCVMKRGKDNGGAQLELFPKIRSIQWGNFSL